MTNVSFSFDETHFEVVSRVWKLDLNSLNSTNLFTFSNSQSFGVSVLSIIRDILYIGGYFHIQEGENVYQCIAKYDLIHDEWLPIDQIPMANEGQVYSIIDVDGTLCVFGLFSFLLDGELVHNAVCSNDSEHWTDYMTGGYSSATIFEAVYVPSDQSIYILDLNYRLLSYNESQPWTPLATSILQIYAFTPATSPILDIKKKGLGY